MNENFKKIEELLRSEDITSRLLGRQLIRNHRAAHALPTLEEGRRYNLTWIQGSYYPAIRYLEKMIFTHLICDPSTHWNKVVCFKSNGGLIEKLSLDQILDLKLLRFSRKCKTKND